MRKNAQILWIEDDPQTEQRAVQLEEDTGMSVEFICLKGKDLKEELSNISKGYSNPNLIIIDHVLNDTRSEEWARLGSSFTGFFRAMWEKCPVFGITRAENREKIDIERYAYDDLMDYTSFSEYIEYIPNVVEGFKKCRKVDSIERWVALLKGPKDESERIKGCMAHDVKTDVQKKGFPNRAYRWFRTKFYKMPGFLYDSDWVATFAGVRKGTIEKYLKHFESARYDGVFDDPGHPRWWKAKLYKVIYGKCKDDNAAYRGSQDVGNEVLCVKKQDRSKCYVCGREWPETVAYVDKPDRVSSEQMHLRCTVAHPDYQYEPMFEEIRMMAGEESG